MEAIAADYITHVRHIRPHGPYRLGAFCLSSVVAFEMARQLGAEGETIEVLALLHIAVPSFRRTRLIRLALEWAGRMMDADETQQMRWYSELRDRRERFVRRWRLPWSRRTAGPADVLHRVPTDESGGQPRGRLRDDSGMDPYFWAVSRYALPRFAGKITLFRGPDGWSGDTTLGWSRLAESVEMHKVPGHDSVLREEVDELAARPGEVLARADQWENHV